MPDATVLASPKGRVVHSLRGFIEQGLRHGDRLPPESKLAAEFSVSRMTLRSALDVLEREGLVRRERNVGCFRAKPNVSASSIMSRTIVLLSDHMAASDGRVFNGSSASVVSGVIDHVSRQGLNFLRVNPMENDLLWLREMIAAQPLGVIVSCWNRPIAWQLNVLQKITDSGLPAVSWADSDALDRFDTVRSDHESGTRQLVRTLAEQGKRRVLRLWTQPASVGWIHSHDLGYEQAVNELGLPQIPAVHVEGLTDREPGSEANFRIRARQFAGYLAEHLHAAEPIDAIMVATDCEAFVASAACKLFGRDDVAVTGYDNYWHNLPEREWESAIPFATIEKSNHMLGQEMAELLLDRVAGKLPPVQQKRLVPQQVVKSN